MGRISGSTDVQQQPLRIRKDDSGITTSIPYESTDPSKLAVAIASLDAQNGIGYDYEESFGKARLEINYPYDFASTPQTYVQPLWEFFAQKVESDLMANNLPIGSGATYNGDGQLSYAGTFPSFGNNINGIGSLIQNDTILVRKAIDLNQGNFTIGLGWFSNPVGSDGLRLQYVPNPAFPDVKKDVPAAVNPIGCYTIFSMNLRNFTASPIFAPVLRFTQTVTSQYAIAASLLNAGNIISTGSMAILEAIPSGLLFNLPNPSNPPATYVVSAGDLVYGWFKDYPTVRQIAQLKYNIVQEWQFGLYPVAVYGTLL